MPTVIIEGPPLPIEKRRLLVSAITDENVARGGKLLADKCRKSKHPMTPR